MCSMCVCVRGWELERESGGNTVVGRVGSRVGREVGTELGTCMDRE